MAFANAHDTISRICIVMFGAEEARLGAELEKIRDANGELWPGKLHVGFAYAGDVYDQAGLARNGQRPRVTLHASLVERMEKYLRDKGQVWTDRLAISQMLFQLLRSCNNLQEVRDALPNCITNTLEEMKNLSRVQQEAWTIQADARLYRQYQKLLPRMEFYTLAKLFY